MENAAENAAEKAVKKAAEKAATFFNNMKTDKSVHLLRHTMRERKRADCGS